MPSEQSREEFNKELVKTLQKIVNPKRLDRIYDRVISHQNSSVDLFRQQYVLELIQDYIKEIDHHFQE